MYELRKYLFVRKFRPSGPHWIHWGYHCDYHHTYHHLWWYVDKDVGLLRLVDCLWCVWYKFICVWNAWVMWLTTRDKCGLCVCEEIDDSVCTTRGVRPHTRYLRIYRGLLSARAHRARLKAEGPPTCYHENTRTWRREEYRRIRYAGTGIKSWRVLSRS